MLLEKCDVCGKESSNRYTLTSLRGCYQTEGVKEVCDDCRKKIAEAIIKVEDVLKPIHDTWIKQIISRLKGE